MTLLPKQPCRAAASDAVRRASQRRPPHMADEDASQVGLEAMRMSVAVLGASGAGKAVNKLKKSDSPLAPRAKKLIEKWKTLAA